MNALALVRHDLTLDELRDAANAEHQLVEQALTTAVHHAILCGEALLVARERFAHNGWEEWAKENFEPGLLRAQFYMRIAHYQDYVRDLPAVSTAMRCLRGMPAIRPAGPDGNPPEVREEARTLHAAGASKSEIAEMLGVTPGTVGQWVDPELLKRHNERQREYHAKRKAERADAVAEKHQKREERLAKRAGGAVAEAYSLAHKLEDALAVARQRAKTPERARAFSEVEAMHHKTKDAIVAMLGSDS